ncbi:MAG: hypothetical protein JXQ83_13420 [Candidatus Glassbacteria bacterium]|nr:hypothetical protein [Candidatus Glassbacteria bacterium]
MDSGTVLVLALIVVFGMVLPVVLFIPAAKRPVSEESLLYQDRYLEVYHDRLVISGYYFGPFGRKSVPFAEVEKVEAVDLNWKTGKYRLQGTGDFRTWFAQDLSRP